MIRDYEKYRRLIAILPPIVRSWSSDCRPNRCLSVPVLSEKRRLTSGLLSLEIADAGVAETCSPRKMDGGVRNYPGDFSTYWRPVPRVLIDSRRLPKSKDTFGEFPILRLPFEGCAARRGSVPYLWDSHASLRPC